MQIPRGHPPVPFTELEFGLEYLLEIREHLPPRDARVLLLGSGPEAAHLALMLVSHGHRGKLVALSPSGVLEGIGHETAASLHEMVAWHRLELKAGRATRALKLMKRGKTRAIRVEYFSSALGNLVKLETDIVIECKTGAR